MQEILAEWFPVFSFWVMIIITITKVVFWVALTIMLCKLIGLISTVIKKLRKVKT